jgi:hypothetical protein
MDVALTPIVRPTVSNFAEGGVNPSKVFPNPLREVREQFGGEFPEIHFTSLQNDDLSICEEIERYLK